MSNQYYPMQPMGYMQPHDLQQQQEFNLLMNAATTGAVIGGTGAAAMQLRRYQQGQATWQDAARGTLKGALQVSVAATAATAVGRMFNNPALSLAATLATGTAVMYVLTREQEEAVDE